MWLYWREFRVCYVLKLDRDNSRICELLSHIYVNVRNKFAKTKIRVNVKEEEEEEKKRWREKKMNEERTERTAYRQPFFFFFNALRFVCSCRWISMTTYLTTMLTMVSDICQKYTEDTLSRWERTFVSMIFSFEQCSTLEFLRLIINITLRHQRQMQKKTLS